MSTMCVTYLSAIPKPSLDHHSMYNKFIRYFNISVFGGFFYHYMYYYSRGGGCVERFNGCTQMSPSLKTFQNIINNLE